MKSGTEAKHRMQSYSLKNDIDKYKNKIRDEVSRGRIRPFESVKY